MPSLSVHMQSGVVDVPSADLSGQRTDMPSVGVEICVDLPVGDVELTGTDVGAEGGGVSLGTGLAAGVTGAVGAAAVGLCLSGKGDKPEGEVRPFLSVIDCCIGYRGKSVENVLAMVTVNTCVF